MSVRASWSFHSFMGFLVNSETRHTEGAINQTFIHSFIHNTPTRKRSHQAQDIHTSHTSHPLHSHAHDVRCIPRSQTRIRVAIPRVNPGSDPVQPPRQTVVWTVADTRTQHIHTTHRLRRHEELMIHDRNRRAARPHRRGHHRAEWPKGWVTVAHRRRQGAGGPASAHPLRGRKE